MAQISTKRLMIDKANTTVVIVTAVAAFITVFSLVASKTLLSQAAYQNRVISAKKEAVSQLKEDIKATGELKTAYTSFNSTAQNIIGGSPTGSGPQDGANADLILDALPSSYDFPVLTTSLEKLITSQNVTINSISGTDDEVAQAGNTSSASPTPVEMPFDVSATGTYASVQNLINAFQLSIRPIQIQTLNISGTNGSLTADITAQTYYQPAKSLNINKKVVQ